MGTLSELSDQDLELSVRNHLSQWFGSGSVDSWQHLKTYRIPYAQPNQVLSCVILFGTSIFFLIAAQLAFFLVVIKSLLGEVDQFRGESVKAHG